MQPKKIGHTPLAPARPMELRLLKGEQVIALLSDEVFQEEWDKLYQVCPWRTVFQSRAFVAAWYRLFHHRHLPLVVTAVAEGRMVGLLSLARVKGAGMLTGAGKNQAFYHTWLSCPAYGQDFIRKALALLREQFPGYGVLLKYVPPNTPLGWLQADVHWRQRCTLRPSSRLFMDLQAPDTEVLLYSNRFAKKLARLKQLGQVRYERIVRTEDFVAVLDEHALQHDLRKGAMYNSCSFKDSPALKQLYRELFELNLLHVTTLRLNQEIIATIIAIVGENCWLHGAYNSHSPLYSKYSPGIVGFLMLGQSLVGEGVARYDLTPGGNTYKQRIANGGDQVHELYVASRAKTIASKVLVANLRRLSMYSLSRIGMDPRAVKSNCKKAVRRIKQRIMLGKEQEFLHALKKLTAWNTSGNGYIVLSGRMEQAGLGDPNPACIRHSSLEDLLHFDQRGGNLTRWDFLQDAMKRLEAGETCFTWSENETLLACAWKPVQPNASLLLCNFYFHRSVEEQPSLFLAPLLQHVRETQKVSNLTILVPATELTLVYALERLGLEREQAVPINDLQPPIASKGEVQRGEW